MYYFSKNLGVCLEKSEGKNNFRIYAEKHVSKKEYLKLDDEMKFKVRNVESIKWDAESPKSFKKTYYESLIRPTPNNIKLAMFQSKVKYIPKIITDTLDTMDKDSFLGTYIVTDNITSRTAVDLKFNRFFQFSEFENELQHWCKKNLKKYEKTLDIYPIHHVSLGVDADEKDYITVYFKL